MLYRSGNSTQCSMVTWMVRKYKKERIHTHTHTCLIHFAGQQRLTQFSFQSKRKAMPKNVQTTTQLYSFHMLAREISKFSKLIFNSMWIKNFQMCKLDFLKGRWTREQIANVCLIIEKAREFQKNIFFCFIDYAKAFDCVDYNNLWENSSRDGKTRRQVKNQQLESDMEQQTGSKSGKEYIKATYCHSAYLTYMQSTSWKMQSWMKHKLESRLPGEIPITSDMHMTPPLWQKVKRN